MKQKITLFSVFLLLATNHICAQVSIDPANFNWSRIENATAVEPLVTNDADNGDGLNDGAMLLKGTSNTPATQGIQYLLGGSPTNGQLVSLETKYYQNATSYVKFKMQIFSITDNLILAQTADLTTATGVVGTGTFSYTFTTASVGDQIAIRFVRTDDLNPVRVLAIDYLKIGTQFVSMTPPPVVGQLALDQANYNWSRIEDATSTAPIVTNDADNGDGLNDGAIQIKGTANTPAIQGIKYLLGGTPVVGEQINLETKYYQYASSYAKFKMQIFNVTDNIALAETASFTTASGVIGTGTLSYVFTAASVGDQIAIRFVRTDDLNPVRVAALDYLKVNTQFVNMLPICQPVFNFDLPLTTATASEISDLAAIRTSLSNQIIGTTAPTAAQLATATAQYDALNIVVTGSTITGNPITVTSQIDFLAIFARHLKFNPSDVTVSDKAVKAVWYIAKQNCNNTNAAMTFYNYPKFSRPAVFLNNYLPANVKALFGNTLYTETDQFKYLFDPNYDFGTTTANGAIITDIMYLDSDVLLAYADWFGTNDEKIRFLKTVKRFLDRFLIYSDWKADGLKKDGLGFHHESSYDAYMYAYGTIANVLKSLENTSFQIDQPSYLRFRDAVYSQVVYSNDAGVKPFSMAGRNPQTKTTSLTQSTLGNLAITGGKILGLATADPVLAGIYNRKYGVNPLFNYSAVTPFEEGYVQFNYGNFGIYRKNNWIASTKGQSDQLFGSEIYINQNRFGRYQSYGSLEIIYSGNSITGNGYSPNGWDWNFNPGTTAIVLPWDSLQVEKDRIDEYNTYGFAGSLALSQENRAVLTKSIGQSGLFAMKFKEKSNVGFGITTINLPNSHNDTFEFNKAYFSIDNYIICLGNGIKNNDAINPTVTTLTQRLNNNANDFMVNGVSKATQPDETFVDSAPNWLLDSYNTGYYATANSGVLKIRNSTQHTPYQNQTAPTAADIAANTPNDYRLAYLDHGTAPTNSSYEYVCLPSINATDMATFAMLMQTNKPYTLHQNTSSSQIIEHIGSKTWAYALPAANTTILNGIIKANDTPCLVMYKSTNQNYNGILLSISNPDLGITPSTPKTIKLTLNYEWTISSNPNASIVSANSTETIIQFNLADGLPVEINLALANPCAIPNATPVAPTLSVTQPTCAIATGSISVSGAIANLSFGLDGTTFGNTTGVFENLAAGDYTVYAKSSNGCISVASNALINAQPTTPAAPTLSVTQPTCAIAIGSISVSDASENLSFGLDGTTFGNTTGVFENLTAGDYTVYAKSSNGCISVASNAIINAQPATPVAPILSVTQPTYSTAGSINVTSEIIGLSFSLDGTIFTNTLGVFENLTSGNYTVYAKSEGGCISAGAYATINTPLDLTVSNNNLQLYYGYSLDQSTVIKGTPTGGKPPYTVAITMNRPLKSNEITNSGDELWVNGVNTGSNSNTICPPTGSFSDGMYPSATSTNSIITNNGYAVTATLMQNATFTITVTDAMGVSASKTTMVSAEDARCFAGNSGNIKIKICHKTENSKNPCQEMCVDQSSVQNHIAHGDFIGVCTSNCIAPIVTAKFEKLAKTTLESTSFDVKAYPNPSSHKFTLVVTGYNSNGKVEIFVYDMLARLLQRIVKNDDEPIVFGEELAAGEYLTVVKQGNNIKVVNLIKI
jgi:chondroitin-sulfate-ABC endolyase/exolyase